MVKSLPNLNRSKNTRNYILLTKSLEKKQPPLFTNHCTKLSTMSFNGNLHIWIRNVKLFNLLLSEIHACMVYCVQIFFFAFTKYVSQRALKSESEECSFNYCFFFCFKSFTCFQSRKYYQWILITLSPSSPSNPSPPL